MILDESVLVTVNKQSLTWLEEVGYKNLKYKEKLQIPIEQLSPNSCIFVNVKCDYCGKELKREYKAIIKGRDTVKKDSCIKCLKFKREEVLQLKYGVTNISYLPEIREKAKKTTLKKHGNFSDYLSRLTKKDIVDKVIKNSNCTFVSTDIQNGGYMKVYIDLICSCGESFKVTLHEFLYGNKRQCNDCGIKRRSGENHPDWKGGITSEEEKLRKSSQYKEWREQIYKRDNYTCQKCGDDFGGNLHAHHIENFSSHEELRFDINNGITLCEDCHTPSKYGSFHYIYGTKNNNRQQLEEYLSSSIVAIV